MGMWHLMLTDPFKENNKLIKRKTYFTIKTQYVFIINIKIIGVI